MCTELQISIITMNHKRKKKELREREKKKHSIESQNMPNLDELRLKCELTKWNRMIIHQNGDDQNLKRQSDCLSPPMEQQFTI